MRSVYCRLCRRIQRSDSDSRRLPTLKFVKLAYKLNKKVMS